MSKYLKNKNGEYICSNANCNFIVKDKKNISTMFYHMKKHEGKLPYECAVCSKDFMQKKSLEIHKLTHTEQKDLYKCPFKGCSYETIQKGNRITHCMRKHFIDEVDTISDDLSCNLSCKVCKKDFPSLPSFYYHCSSCISVKDVDKNKVLNSIL
jgi:hypothetical protein